MQYEYGYGYMAGRRFAGGGGDRVEERRAKTQAAGIEKKNKGLRDRQ